MVTPMIDPAQSALTQGPLTPLPALGSDAPAPPVSTGEQAGSGMRPVDTASFSPEALALLKAEQCSGGT